MAEQRKTPAKPKAPAKTPTRAAAKPRGKPRKPPVKPRSAKPRSTKLNMVERVQLAQRIYAARTKPNPDPWAEISRRERVPERTLHYTLDKYLEEAETYNDTTGQKALEETLLLYAAAIERLGIEADKGDSSSARVGAARALLDAVKARIELLAVMGRMPRNFRALEEMGTVAQMIRRFADLLERHEVDAAIIQDFLVLVDEMHPVIEGEGTVRSLPRAS